jgi:hypothetical protein
VNGETPKSIVSWLKDQRDGAARMAEDDVLRMANKARVVLSENRSMRGEHTVLGPLDSEGQVVGFAARVPERDLRAAVREPVVDRDYSSGQQSLTDWLEGS